MIIRTLLFATLALAACAASAQPSAASRPAALDRVVAVVNDEALTQYDLEEAKRIVLQQLKQQNVQQPAPDVLEKQLLERLVTRYASTHPRAQHSGQNTLPSANSEWARCRQSRAPGGRTGSSGCNSG